MTRKLFTVITATTFLLLVWALPLAAQDRQLGDRPSLGGREGQRQMISIAEAEKFQRDLVNVYKELEATLKFLADHSVVRDTAAMKDYESVNANLVSERKRIEQTSALDLAADAQLQEQAKSFPRIVEIAQRVRTDAKFEEVLRKAEQFNVINVAHAAKSGPYGVNARGAVAAPSFISPTCDFDNPRDYPSGADVAIANGVAIALHTAADALPDSFSVAGFSFPNVFRIVLVIAAGAADEITNGLTGAQWDGAWCEATRLFVEDKLSSDEGFVAIQMTDFYLKFTLRTVRAALSRAQSDGIPVNCGPARLAEANAFFDPFDNFIGASRLDAYKKLRTAYQNIAAATCVQ